MSSFSWTCPGWDFQMPKMSGFLKVYFFSFFLIVSCLLNVMTEKLFDR